MRTSRISPSTALRARCSLDQRDLVGSVCEAMTEVEATRWNLPFGDAEADAEASGAGDSSRREVSAALNDASSSDEPAHDAARSPPAASELS
jgi:hypothetical protein|mmetsp:Transcript_816/g.3391  ORF Transcript_816/g.3391 Transcript_816/m.3391 type:complete len:92 (+) Transcript_816:1281-1556(+)